MMQYILIALAFLSMPVTIDSMQQTLSAAKTARTKTLFSLIGIAALQSPYSCWNMWVGRNLSPEQCLKDIDYPCFQKIFASFNRSPIYQKFAQYGAHCAWPSIPTNEPIRLIYDQLITRQELDPSKITIKYTSLDRKLHPLGSIFPFCIVMSNNCLYFHQQACDNHDLRTPNKSLLTQSMLMNKAIYDVKTHQWLRNFCATVIIHVLVQCGSSKLCSLLKCDHLFKPNTPHEIYRAEIILFVATYLKVFLQEFLYELYQQYHNDQLNKHLLASSTHTPALRAFGTYWEEQIHKPIIHYMISNEAFHSAIRIADASLEALRTILQDQFTKETGYQRMDHHWITHSPFARKTIQKFEDELHSNYLSALVRDAEADAFVQKADELDTTLARSFLKAAPLGNLDRDRIFQQGFARHEGQRSVLFDALSWALVTYILECNHHRKQNPGGPYEPYETWIERQHHIIAAVKLILRADDGIFVNNEQR